MAVVKMEILDKVDGEIDLYERLKSKMQELRCIAFIEVVVTDNSDRNYVELFRKVDKTIKSMFVTYEVIKMGDCNYFLLSASQNSTAWKISVNAKVMTVNNILNVYGNVVRMDTRFSDVRADDLSTLPSAIETMTKLKTKPIYGKQSAEIDAVLNSFKVALFESTAETESHCARISYYNKKVAEELSLTEEEVETAYLTGWLHDIGKIAIEDSILNKPSKLSGEEWIRMEEHAAIGWRILKDVPGFEQISLGVRHHHERYDGNGYPDKISGEDIPFHSRITTITDSFDTMLSKRSYKESMSLEYAIGELLTHKGKQFDPLLVEVFVKLIRKGEFSNILKTYGE